jgi:hypothetical protein
MTVDLVLAPYLVNIKNLGYDTAYSKIVEWLDRCGRIRILEFNPRLKISYALKQSLRTGNKAYEIGNHEGSLS